MMAEQPPTLPVVSDMLAYLDAEISPHKRHLIGIIEVEPRPWFRVGDIVTRAGSDRQRVISTSWRGCEGVAMDDLTRTSVAMDDLTRTSVAKSDLTALSRRHILAGAAATAAAAALPAVAVADVARFDVERFIAVVVAETERLHPGVNAGPTSARVIQFMSTREFVDFIASGADLSNIEMEFI
jgi:hypothetical protein